MKKLTPAKTRNKTGRSSHIKESRLKILPHPVKKCGQNRIFPRPESVLPSLPQSSKGKVTFMGGFNTFLFCKYNKNSTPNEACSTTSVNQDVSKIYQQQYLIRHYFWTITRISHHEIDSTDVANLQVVISKTKLS